MVCAHVYSAQPTVSGAHLITIEADITKGLHAFTIVGLPDKAVEEARDRVSAAIKNSGWTSPKQRNQKITIALAPADLKKSGPLFDLPIAMSYLLAAQEVNVDPAGKLFVGELALDGSVRAIRGALSIAQEARRHGIHELYLPAQNAAEAALVSGITVYPVQDLESLRAHFQAPSAVAHEASTPDVGVTIRRIEPVPHTTPQSNATDAHASSSFTDIRGQEIAKRGLLIAAAGGHNIAMWGPPGTGKTMLARACVDLLPTLDESAMLEVTAIHSVAGALESPVVTRPPFRSPHHSSSHVSIVGGGTIPKPGEATLAHRGILFLDEFPEFDMRVIESLRQPLEEGVIHVSRVKGSERFPARFMLVAAMNPCPCGYLGDAQKACTCTPSAIAKYRRKLSGPIMDRIDLWVEVLRLPHEDLAPGRRDPNAGAQLQTFQQLVAQARTHQHARFTGHKTATLNAHMTVHDLDRLVPLARSTQTLLNESAKKLDLSPRAYHRVIKLARTIADLDESRLVQDAHILEALHYRPKSWFGATL